MIESVGSFAFSFGGLFVCVRLRVVLVAVLARSADHADVRFQDEVFSDFCWEGFGGRWNVEDVAFFFPEAGELLFLIGLYSIVLRRGGREYVE